MKKPSASATLYLRAAAVNQAAKVEPLPPTKANWQEYERLRELVRRIRRMAGYSPWFPIGAATASCILLIVAATRYASRTYYYTWPDNYLRVVQNLDPCDGPDGVCGKRFVVQAVSRGASGNGTIYGDRVYPETVMHFRDPQHFEAGMTFSHISFKYIGSEAVTDGWDVVRDFEGMPVLAPNCKPDYSKAPTAGHIRCEGGKARF